MFFKNVHNNTAMIGVDSFKKQRSLYWFFFYQFRLMGLISYDSFYN